MTPHGGFLRAVLDALPAPLFVVDDDVCIRDCNAAARAMVGAEGLPVLMKRGGEALHCIHAAETAGGCGASAACGDCVVRNSVRSAAGGGRVSRRMHRMLRAGAEGQVEVNVLVTASPFRYEGEALVLLVLEDITELDALRRIVPMCASCRKVRDDDEYWQRVEQYFERHLDIDVSHGICPECEARLYPEFSRP
jgi:PAS domain-containing protein